ncbi:MAG: serine/threonine-protein kinase [Anaerolineaceae bacterium]|nr:serine/threonine-protein kinase [Anaerolineaceae bacterium]
MTLAEGAILNNRYRIEKVIAKGGMGAIYQAFDQSLGVLVAVKENLFVTNESSRQFHREATILAGLRHPNLPRVIDHFVISGQGQYLAMDFIEGEDLKEILSSDKTISEDETVLIGAAICDALNYLHNRQPPVVHRDIKPGNIKITPNKQFFLVDFGLAKQSKPGIMTTTGAQALTPGFAPPEQYGQGTDTQSDIYSLGATLYNCLTGKVPEDGLARALKTEKLTPIRNLNPEISKKLAAPIEKALSVSKSQRYVSAREFKQDLLNASSMARDKNNMVQQTLADTMPKIDVNGPLSAATRKMQASERIQLEKMASTAPPKRSRLPLLLGIGGGVLVAACLVIAGYLAFTGQIPGVNLNQNKESSTLPQDTSTPVEVVELTSTIEPASEIPTKETQAPSLEPQVQVTNTLEFTSTPESTPKGGGSGKIAFVSDRSGTLQIYSINIDGSDLFQITNEVDGACQPNWSPDGLALVYTSPCPLSNIAKPGPVSELFNNASIFMVSHDGNNRDIVAPYPGGGDFDPSWSPDGKQIAFSSYRSNRSTTDLDLFLYTIEDGSVKALTADLSKDRRPIWSPDGKYLAFERRRNEDLIWVMDMASGESTPFSDQNSSFAYIPAWSVDDIIVFSQGQSNHKINAKKFGVSNAPEVNISNGPAWYVDFSNDNRWMVYQTQTIEADNSRHYDIQIMPSNGGTGIPLNTQKPNMAVNDYHPAWRP